MNVDQIAHALGEVMRRAVLRYLHRARWPMHVEDDKQVDRTIATILVVVAPRLARRGGSVIISPISCVGLSRRPAAWDRVPLRKWLKLRVV